MAATSFDINKLRQLALLQGYDSPDIMGGIMNQQPPNPIDQLRQGTRSTIPIGNSIGGQNAQQTPPTDLPMGNIFQQQPQAPQEDPTDPMARINQVYTPETTSRDRFNRLLDEMPEREEPSIMRRIVAGGMGLSTKSNPVADPIGTQEKVMYAPYLRDMATWKEKAGPYQQAAQLENTANINERTLAGNVLTADAAAKRIESQQATTEEKNRIAEIRAKAYAWKQMHPDWDWDTTGPTILLKGPNGEIKDTGLPTGKMSQEDLQLLKNKGNVAAATARAGGQVDVATIRGTILMRDAAGNQYHFNPNTKELKPIGGAPETPKGELVEIAPERAAGAGATAKEQNDQQQLKYREIMQKYPELQGHFKVATNGTITFTPRPKPSLLGNYGIGTGWEQVKSWDRANKLINPDYVPPDEREPGETSGIAPTGGAPAQSKSGSIAPTGDYIPPVGGRGRKGPSGELIHKPPATPQAPPSRVRKGYVEIFKNGVSMGQIEATPENIQQAIKEKYQIKVGG